MIDLDAVLQPRLDEPALAWFQGARERLAADPARTLPVLFPALARRTGREALGGGWVQDGDVRVDLSTWRTCDAAGTVLVDAAAPDDDALLDLFLHGDKEERTIVLRSATVRPVTDVTVRLLHEVQRTNTNDHFEAAVCDGNLAVRAAAARDDYGVDDLNRLVLKMAFIGLPLERLHGVVEHANDELSVMLEDFAVEREAAGRDVWPGTHELIARAPVDTTLPRLHRYLDHEDERHRLACARGLEYLADAELCAAARRRLEAETHPAVRGALERALS